MVKVISTINLKGGVGKTTTTIALAEFVAAERYRKVLLIDLDPQTNATISLIGEALWQEKNERRETLHQLFTDHLQHTSKFNIRSAIVKNVSPIDGGIHTIDLLPSSLDLVDIQDSLGTCGSGVKPVHILRNAVVSILGEYDYIFIDCPPNMGSITLNGLFVSDFYLIPCIPDYLSTYGIPQIIQRVNRFKQNHGAKIRPLGIIINMYRKQTKLHVTMADTLRAKSAQQDYPRIFTTMIPYTTNVEQGVEYFDRAIKIKQKWGSTEVVEAYKSLANEFMQYVKQ